jgi:uncharacterized membrane protein
MNMTSSQIGKALLRYGFVFVFLWFGINQLLHPDMWTMLIPTWVTSFSGLTAHTFVLINGGVEVFLALMLTLNIFTSIVSVLLSLHLLSIAAILKFNAVGIRDGVMSISLLLFASQDSPLSSGLCSNSIFI